MAKDFPKALFDGWFVKILYPNNVVVATIETDEDGEFVDNKGSITKTLEELLDWHVPTKKPIQVCIVEPIVKSATMQKHVARYNARLERKEEMTNVISEEHINAVKLKPFPVTTKIEIDPSVPANEESTFVGLITKSIISINGEHVKEAVRDYFKKYGYDVDNKNIDIFLSNDTLNTVVTFYSSSIVEMKDSKI